ncbi:MAG: hypothetical protein ACE5HE_02025 [Phycisphaerae bacterium]
MVSEEKELLLALFDDERRWCQEAEAHDAKGDSVRYDAASAVAWDITGALCRLFGWRRACVLFGQLDRHIHGKRVRARWPGHDIDDMQAMAALQDFNDQADTTFQILRERIASMPVWHGGARRLGEALSEECAPHDAEVE